MDKPSGRPLGFPHHGRSESLTILVDHLTFVLAKSRGWGSVATCQGDTRGWRKKHAEFNQQKV